MNACKMKRNTNDPIETCDQEEFRKLKPRNCSTQNVNATVGNM
jgi:hypothetical protein